MTDHRPAATSGSRSSLWLLALLATASLLVTFAVLVCLPLEAPPLIAVPPNVPVVDVQPTDPRTQALAHLDRADAACSRALDEHLARLAAFFRDAHGRVPAFADRVLGWHATGALIGDTLGLGSGHAAFVQKAFAETLFTTSDLDAELRFAIAGYVDVVHDIESALVLALQADLAIPTTSLPFATLDPPSLPSPLDPVFSAAIAAARTSVLGDLAREITSLLAGELLVQAALGLGAGATSLTTCGAGLFAALAVDHALSLVWDGRERLIQEIDHRLDTCSRLLLDGRPSATGLRTRLESFDRSRSARRRELVLEALARQGAHP